MITGQQRDFSPPAGEGKRVGFLICTFFVLSGMCGLVYEVVWDRYLISFIGVTTYAHTVVLTTFMGGLALGSYLFGRLVGRISDGLRLYGWLEVGIGLYTVIFPYSFQVMGDLYVALAKPLYPQISWLTLARFILCTAVLLPPTVLMGGTLPVLANYLTTRRSSLRSRISFLYAANSGGAVLGTYLAGFWFLAEFGLPMTLVFIGSFNVFLGLAAVFLSSFLKRPEKLADEDSGNNPDALVYTPREVKTAFAVAGLSGAVTMALEVAWVRFWGLVLGSSTYSFSLMLMAFISGISLGSTIVASRLGRRRLPPLLFALFLGTAAILLLGLPFYDRVPYWFARLRLWFADTHGSYVAFQFLVYGGCFLLMFVPTVLSGMALPAAIRIASQAIDRVGRDVGRIYAVNTIGTMAGSLLCGLVLLSWLGLEATFRFLFILYLVGAGIVWMILRERHRHWPGIALVVLAGIHFLSYVPWNKTVMNEGLYRQGRTNLVPQADTWGQYLKTIRGLDQKLKEVYEGPSTTVAIFEGGNGYLSMFINGKVEASLGDEVSQRMTAHFPLLAHSLPQEGLVIGLGSGSTAAAMESHDLKRIDVVELHPEVVAGSHAFDQHTGSILTRPNVNLYVDDALHFLRVSGKKYDVIASEPTNPWQSGVGNLFSKEFYQLASASLYEGGILSQWMPTYEISDEIIYILLRTITSVFPYVEVFQMISYDVILLASNHPIHPQWEMIQERMVHPPLKKNLEELGITKPAALASLHLATNRDLRRMLPRGPLNYLDHPIAEFKAPEPFFRKMNSVVLDRIDTRFFLRPASGLWWNDLMKNRLATPEELKSIRTTAQKGLNNKILWAANRALVHAETWDRLPDDLSLLRWREAPPGESCRVLRSLRTVGQLVQAYFEEKRYFFSSYSPFYRPDPVCPAQLAKKLLDLDPERKNLWQRELGVWLWIQGDREKSSQILRSWLKERLNGVWEDDDLRAINTLVRALIATDQADSLKPVMKYLRKVGRWPEDLLTLAEAHEYQDREKSPGRSGDLAQLTP